MTNVSIVVKLAMLQQHVIPGLLAKVMDEDQVAMDEDVVVDGGIMLPTTSWTRLILASWLMTVTYIMFGQCTKMKHRFQRIPRIQDDI